MAIFKKENGQLVDFSNPIPDTSIAPIENGATSTHNYVVGAYALVKGILKKVTNAISIGTAFSDSNSETTDVATELKELNDDVTTINTHLTKLEQNERVTVTGNGVKTASTLLGELANIIDISKVTLKSFIVRESSASISRYNVEVVSISGILETSLIIVEGGVFKTNIINLNTSLSTASFGQATLNGYTSRDADVIPNGEKFHLYY